MKPRWLVTFADPSLKLITVVGAKEEDQCEPTLSRLCSSAPPRRQAPASSLTHRHHRLPRRAHRYRGVPPRDYKCSLSSVFLGSSRLPSRKSMSGKLKYLPAAAIGCVTGKSTGERKPAGGEYTQYTRRPEKKDGGRVRYRPIVYAKRLPLLI